MKKIIAGIVAVLVVASGALAMTAEEELEAWKKEPAYGKTIKSRLQRRTLHGDSRHYTRKGILSGSRS